MTIFSVTLVSLIAYYHKQLYIIIKESWYRMVQRLYTA
jgi:hypothetical protein